MRNSLTSLLAVAALTVACSSPGNGAADSGGGNGSTSGGGDAGEVGSGGDAESSGGGSTDGAPGAPGADGGSEIDSSAIDGAQGADAAGSFDSGGGGGSGKLYPLAVGYSWTYDVQPVGAGAVCASGTQLQKVTGTTMVDGREAFNVASFCAAAGTSDVAPVGTGDEVDFDYQASWLVMIDPTLLAGHAWSYLSTSYTWVRPSSVTVPAGTYTDCWTAQQNVSYTAYITYCRGVGMVRSYSQDLSGQGWDAQLMSKSF